MKVNKFTGGALAVVGVVMTGVGPFWLSEASAAEVNNTAVDAGDLRRTVPPVAAPKPKVARPLNVPRPQQSVTPASEDTVRLRIDRVNFVGNTVFDQDVLRALIRPWVGKDLNLSEMKQMAGEVAKSYRDAGYLVHAFVPPQPLNDNVLIISVSEGRLSSLAISPGEPVRLDKRRALAWINAAIPQGALINTVKTDRNLLLLDDLAGLRASARLRRSESVGYGDMVLTLEPRPWIEGLLHVSNSGAESTGAERLSGNVLINSPLRRGDQLGADITVSEHSQFVRASYRNPLGMKGWSMGLHASALKYDLKGKVAALSSKGDTTDFSAGLKYAQLRTRSRNLNLGLSWGSSQFDNRALGETTSAYDISDLALSVEGDSLKRNRWSQFQLELSTGKLDLGEVNLSENTELPEKFTKLHYQFTSGWNLKRNTTVKLNVRGQYSPDALDSAERFSLGGPAGVRAYPVSEGSGEVASVMSLEVSRPLARRWQVGAFFDHGTVRRRATGSVVDAERYNLEGVGLSARWSSPSGWHLSTQLARRLGNNPSPTATGRDHDGTLNKNRLWLSLHRQF